MYKVGDKVKTKRDTFLWSKGAEGKVLIKEGGVYLVQFQKGEFKKLKDSEMWAVQATDIGQWWATGTELELYEGKKMVKKSEGDGYAVTAWGVEVNGELKVNTVSTTRAIAREERSFQEAIGHKAVVRKVQIQAVKGKI